MSSNAEQTVLRFGILGAARIAPDAIIKPAKTHPGVSIVAVACRDEKRGSQFARKHKIPKVFTGSKAYLDLLADPDVDAVYNPLPNGLHFEWTMRALEAGKHVLLEKPMTDTAEESRQIFALAEAKGLVVLEAMHSTFHPALQRTREIVQSGELGKVKSIKASISVPRFFSRIFFTKDDVRFKYELGGGCTLDMGVYTVAVIRLLTGNDKGPALEVTSAVATGHPSDPERIDRAMHATYALPDSATAESVVDFSRPGWGPFGLIPGLPDVNVIVSLEGGEVTLMNHPVPSVYHSINVKPKKGPARTEKAYTFADGRGDKSWSTYRYQLEAFVDKVQGRTPWVWITPETTITEMETLERVYAKSGLPPRFASPYKSEASAVASTSGDAA
ncbi:NAD-P-binding protein [Lenzites betulinus]|nr:NAD-P-binding protein [Lenzites betulinus]